MTIEKSGSKQFSFVLRKLDQVSGCWLQQTKFDIFDLAELQTSISVYLPEPLSSEFIGATDYSRLVRQYSLPIDDHADLGELEQLSESSSFFPEGHTGRELLLMIAGKKPMAAFVEVCPDDEGLGIIPEEKFEPYVKNGHFLKYEYHSVVKGSANRTLRRVLYGIPGQEWRFKAHEMLWRTAENRGWNDGFEIIEGFLLGYETEIDQFFSCATSRA